MKKAVSKTRIAASTAAALFSAVSIAQAQGPAAAAPKSATIATQIKVPAPQAPKKTVAKWKINTSAAAHEGENARGQVAGLGLTLDLQHSINSNFLVKAVGGYTARSGYAQTRFGEIQPKGGIGLGEGSLQAKASALSIRAGIVNQAFWGASQIVDANGWLGSIQALKIGDEYTAELQAGQSVPTSNQLEAKTTGTEPTPGFTVEMLKLGANPKNAWLGASVYGGHWQYHNLPSAVAKESDVGGNSLIEVNGKTQYKYQFEGWLAGGSAQINFTEESNLEGHLQVMQNTRAPEAFNAAQTAGATATIGLPGQVSLATTLDFFFNESDVAPASFNGGAHNNRDGMGVTLESDFKKLGFKLIAEFADISVINPHPLMERFQTYFLKFETHYANF